MKRWTNNQKSFKDFWLYGNFWILLYIPMMRNSLHSVAVLSVAGWSWWLEHRWLPLQNLVGMSTVNSHPELVSHHQHPSHCLDLVVWAFPAWKTYCLLSWSHYTPLYIVPGSKCTHSTKLHTLSRPHVTTTSASAVVIKTRTYTFQIFCNDHF